MKRDEDLIRKILLIIEVGGETYEVLRDELKIIDYTYEQVGYHCYLLYKDGCIDGIDVGFCGDGCTQVYTTLSLTPEGHGYIDEIKNDKTWIGKMKNFLKKSNINIMPININS
jgi:hypothetical protein